MADRAGLVALIAAIAAGERETVRGMLDAAPELATARVARPEEFFAAQCRAQVYAGDTALHAAAFAYDPDLVRDLVGRGADVRARNRRGAEPLHAAVMGEPGSAHWAPDRQGAVIDRLVEAGADPDAAAAGGVTPLHRAVRNRCSAGVDHLLRAGADPRRANDSGSTPADLAQWTTGRGGSGSEAARVEQRVIVELLRRATT